MDYRIGDGKEIPKASAVAEAMADRVAGWNCRTGILPVGVGKGGQNGRPTN